jgi:hypothetical protein
MKEFFKSMVSENSEVSSVRIMSLMCVLFAFITALYSLHVSADPEKVSWLVAAFLAPAFGGKVWQKRFEKPKQQ